jgi:hypothetical protein
MSFELLMTIRRLGALGLLCLATGGVQAQSQIPEEDFSELDKTWKEISLQLPAAPKPENLLEFYVSPTATQKFAVDGTSITVGKDGVVRYTLVSISEAGARNISYEGIRCETLQMRVYAFGQADGSWSRSRRENWEVIMPNSRNRQHPALASEFLCVDRVIGGTAEQMAGFSSKSVRSIPCYPGGSAPALPQTPVCRGCHRKRGA